MGPSARRQPGSLGDWTPLLPTGESEPRDGVLLLSCFQDLWVLTH